MLATWGRVLARTSGLNAFPISRTVILPASTRALATVSAPKKAAVTTTKKTATTTTTKAKAPAKTTTSSATAKTPSKGAAAKPAAKKASGKQTAATKATTKATTAKKPAKLTEDQKARANIKSLLAKALSPPAPIHQANSSWLVFLKDKWNSVPKTPGTPAASIVAQNKDAWVAEYKALSPEKLEALKALAEAKKESNHKDLTDWVNKHTPSQIYSANIARSAIRKLQKLDPVPRGLKTKSFPAIPDPRYPTKPRSANVFFVKEKMIGVSADQRFGLLGASMKEFGTLPEAEKKKFKDLAAADMARYHQELKGVGILPTSA